MSASTDPVKNVLDYFSVLEESRPGDVFEVEYIRETEHKTVKLTLSNRPKHYGY